jgi:hypothetical protein
MIPGEKLAAPKLAPVTATVLAGIVVSGEEKRVGDLATEPSGNVDEANEPDDQRKRHLGLLRPKSPIAVGLQQLGLSVENQTDRPPDRDDRERLVRCVECETAHR